MSEQSEEIKSGLSPEGLAELEEVKQKYATSRGALLPALYIAEREYGWLSAEALMAVSEALGVPPVTVKGTATFYSMYKKKPMGRHVIQLCTNVACMIFGAESLVTLIKERYGVEPGGTSEDGRFSLVIMECIGACDRAPAMLVNDDFHHTLTAENIFDILEKYQ